MDIIGNDPSSRNLIKQMMLECQKVGQAVGVNFGVSIDKRIDGASSIIGHKPSTRQDIEMKRPLEIDPIMSAIIEIGNKLNIATPMLKHINSILKLKANYLGLYRFMLLSKLTNKIVIALGGISKLNQKKIKLLDCYGISGISYFE